jgi:hypothetical protein
VKLSQANPTTSQANLCNAFQLSPAAFAVCSPQSSNVTDVGADGYRFDVSNLANDLEGHWQGIKSNVMATFKVEHGALFFSLRDRVALKLALCEGRRELAVGCVTAGRMPAVPGGQQGIMANMKVGRLLVPLFLVLALAVAINIEAYVEQQPKSPGADSTNRARVAEPDKEARIRNALAELLADSGVHVTATLPVADGQTYKELRVRWQSSRKQVWPLDDDLKHGAGPGAFTAIASARKSGRLPRDRSFELSTNQILVIAVNENAELRWWRLLLDPRLVRAETPSATGETRGEEYYLTNVDFMIAYPDDLGIRELRVYHPRWTGKTFQLKVLSTLPLE